VRVCHVVMRNSQVGRRGRECGKPLPNHLRECGKRVDAIGYARHVLCADDDVPEWRPPFWNVAAEQTRRDRGCCHRSGLHAIGKRNYPMTVVAQPFDLAGVAPPCEQAMPNQRAGATTCPFYGHDHFHCSSLPSFRTTSRKASRSTAVPQLKRND
jgi:hypothetical protein